MSRRQMRLGAFLMAGGHHISAWRHPDAFARAGTDIGHFIELARIAERGKFDMLFVEDAAAIRERNPEMASQAARSTGFEPLSLLAAIAVNTRHIGLVATASTTYNHPYELARAFSTIVLLSKGRAGWMTKLQDLADPRMKGKVVLPPPGDITNGGLFLGLASELGKDYKDVNQMKEVVDWAVANIGPNVLKYTPDSAEMQQLLRSGAADAVSFWNSLARLEYFGGNTDAALLVPSAIYPVNGYLWVPKGAAHPVLAQVFINWRLAKDVQFPNAWPIDHGPWSELSEGFLGPDYVDQIPDWFAKDYFNYFPNLDQIKAFKQVDWKAYNSTQKEWQDYYASKIGQ